MRSGKTYSLIVQAVADAATREQGPYVLWASPEMAGRAREIADMMGVKVEIRVGYKENPILRRK